MTARQIAEIVLLAFIVILCWLGCIGMLRMRQPMQSLHFLALPAVATVPLTVAVFLHTGMTQASWKTLFIAITLLGINSVVAHATARAFRVRELGHWEPLPGDDVVMLHASDEGESS